MKCLSHPPRGSRINLIQHYETLNDPASPPLKQVCARRLSGHSALRSLLVPVSEGWLIHLMKASGMQRDGGVAGALIPLRVALALETSICQLALHCKYPTTLWYVSERSAAGALMTCVHDQLLLVMRGLLFSVMRS